MYYDSYDNKNMLLLFLLISPLQAGAVASAEGQINIINILTWKQIHKIILNLLSL